MSELEISFIIPCKNEANMIKRTVDSIVKVCNGLCVEIIVCDNESTDDTEKVASSLGDNVVYLYSKAVTVAGVRNEGASISYGKILVFVDADTVLGDSWKSGYYALLNKNTINTNWFSGSHVLEPKDEKCFPERWYDDAIPHKKNKYMNSAHFIVPKITFNLLRGFDENLVSGEDYEFSERLINKGCELQNIRELVAFHYGYPRNIREFMIRESWHGMGDFSNLGYFLNSKVALISTVFFILHLFCVIAFFTGAVDEFIILAFFTIVIPIASVIKKFGARPLGAQSRKIAVFYLYFLARFFSLFRVLAKKYTY